MAGNQEDRRRADQRRAYAALPPEAKATKIRKAAERRAELLAGMTPAERAQHRQWEAERVAIWRARKREQAAAEAAAAAE